jgi:hypothetical protein
MRLLMVTKFERFARSNQFHISSPDKQLRRLKIAFR